jgi:NAD-dependent dihydropyrimidine dehydrogenase PreA subunit
MKGEIMKEHYDELAVRISAAGSRYIPRLFEIIADEDEARLMLAMPGAVPELSRKTGIPENRLEEMLKLLFQKGLAFYSKKTTPPTWRMCRSVGQFHDASILWPGVSEEFLKLWSDYSDTEWIDASEAAAKAHPGVHMRVIPIDTAVESDQQVLPFEDVNVIVQNAERLAVVPCPCRVSARKCDKPKEVCMQLNRAADYAIERGTGREITKAEAVDILRESQKAGLVHMTVNSKTSEHVICNCCGCCCIMIPVLVQRGVGMLGPSRYLAKVDPDSCTACGACEEICPFKAVSMEDTALISREKCFGCGVCAVACPVEAIALVSVREPSSIPG